MDDLRWVLLLVGGLVIAAVYFSGRFEREDWVREREQLNARKKPAQTKKSLAKKMSGKINTMVKPSPFPLPPKPRTEPQMLMQPDVEASVDDMDVIASSKDSKKELGTAVPFDEVAEIVSMPNSKTTVNSDPSPTASEIPLGVMLADKDETISALDVKVDNADDVPEIEIPEARFFDIKPPETKSSEISASVIESPGVEDEIIKVDIPIDLAVAEAELLFESHDDDALKSEVSQSELPLNVEPLVLVITVMAEDEIFTGIAVQEALEAEGLQHGDMQIFHCFKNDVKASSDNSTGDNVPVFSVASLVEPGYFDPDKIADMEMPGLTLFCQLPGPLPGEEALELMLDKARGIAVRLDGQMCDDKRNRFTTQAKTHYQDRIATFSRELELAKKKADV